MSTPKITIRKHQYLDEDSKGCLLDMVYRAYIGDTHVGVLKACEINVPKAYQQGKAAFVGDLMDRNASINSLCIFAFGETGMLVQDHLEEKGEETYTNAFASMAKQFNNYRAPKGPNTDFAYRLLYIKSLVVEREFRGQGIGRLLIEALGKRNKQHHADGKATFIALKVFPLDGESKQYELGTKKHAKLFKKEQEALMPYYLKLGFVSNKEDPKWMLHEPNLLYRQARERKKLMKAA